MKLWGVSDWLSELSELNELSKLSELKSCSSDLYSSLNLLRLLTHSTEINPA